MPTGRSTGIRRLRDEGSRLNGRSALIKVQVQRETVEAIELSLADLGTFIERMRAVREAEAKLARLIEETEREISAEPAKALPFHPERLVQSA